MVILRFNYVIVLNFKDRYLEFQTSSLNKKALKTWKACSNHGCLDFPICQADLN